MNLGFEFLYLVWWFSKRDNLFKISIGVFGEKCEILRNNYYLTPEIDCSHYMVNLQSCILVIADLPKTSNKSPLILY